MNLLKDAKIVLRILKENGYSAFIVGGAVRDYLLKTELNDIDITTSAKPHEVSKLFKSVPSGIKYGTVTVFFKDSQFEVTTFRSESNYVNNRHPEEVDFDVTEEDDVKRRDFTMNGLLMDDKGLIIDHVDGMKDIKYKIIKTIGNPDERFNEDALRMMRAFHFVAKLGFKIDLDTQTSITKNKALIKNISSERVLDEMLKILKGDNLKATLEAMVETKIHEELPGLAKGIEFFSRQLEMPMTDIFFATSFTLNKGVPSYWKFSNKHRHKYESVRLLAGKSLEYGALELYQYGLEICQAANRVNYILGKTKLQSLDLAKKFEELPITSELDLKFRARDILSVTNKKAGAWVNKLIQEMVFRVLDGKLKNEYDNLKQFVLDNYETI
ncbi:MAG TPA: CCA tRNA nucleotidyltransferase [Acholeplasmataceae bacterium]|nr:CCA tRNA nucleotidyltransferase [Acholeplasmataceae bacterium]